MALVKVPENREKEMLDEFCEHSVFTFEGLDIKSHEGKKSFKEFEKMAMKAGFQGKEVVGYWFTGKVMNTRYGLTDKNAYPEDLTFVAVPNLYNPQFKLACNARWFDDIVANNNIKQNAILTGQEPDYQ